MGAWGVGSLENDDALDFLGRIEKSPDARGALDCALTAVLDADTSTDGLRAVEAIAAAAVVAQLVTPSSVEGAGRPEGRIAALGMTRANAMALAGLAAAAVDRVATPGSEVGDRWEEAGRATAWRATLDRIQAGLTTG